MSGLVAARRDCSFYANPAGFGSNPRPSKMHAIVDRKDGSRGPACGYPFHDETTEESAAGLLESEKCERPGCKKAFALTTTPESN